MIKWGLKASFLTRNQWVLFNRAIENAAKLHLYMRITFAKHVLKYYYLSFLFFLCHFSVWWTWLAVYSESNWKIMICLQRYLLFSRAFANSSIQKLHKTTRKFRNIPASGEESLSASLSTLDSTSTPQTVTHFTVTALIFVLIAF